MPTMEAAASALRYLGSFSVIALVVLTGQAAQAQPPAGGKSQVPPAAPQSVRAANVEKAASVGASLANVYAELDRLQRQLDDLKRQVNALRTKVGPAPIK